MQYCMHASLIKVPGRLNLKINHMMKLTAMFDACMLTATSIDLGLKCAGHKLTLVIDGLDLLQMKSTSTMTNTLV